MTAEYPDCPDWCDGRCYDGVGDIWNSLGGRGICESDSPPYRRRTRRRLITNLQRLSMEGTR